MKRAALFVTVVLLGVYLALFWGCLQSHPPDADAAGDGTNPATSETVAASVRAVNCIVPRATVPGVAASALVVAVGVAAGRLLV